MKSAKIISISLLILIGFLEKSQSQIFIGTTEIDTSSIVTGLDTPWEILWGPDDHIWLTERRGTISRLNPETGEITELITIGDVHEQGESGLLGMVLHPDFINHPYVFVAYTYLDSGIKERLVRYTYSDGELASPVTYLEGIDGASNHNGSRLIIDAEQRLYMTTGDGANTSQPQDLNSPNGKVLRMNLDGSYPEDNPFQDSYVWTWGHRNAQGLVISPLGLMYSSEHGTSMDDELNIIEKGRNYGWPEVQGFCDDPSETQFCADSNVVEPIAAWTPTLAVAGTDFYSHSIIPEWQNSVLVTSLKDRSLTVLKLSPDGRSVISEDLFFDYWWGRLRDICISPDGRVFLAVSNRDDRGTVQPGDDRIVEIVSLNVPEYCPKEENASFCPGETYNFYGQEIGQPGIYTDTLINADGCDTIVSLTLEYFEIGSTGLEESVTMGLDDTITLTANDGFISYEWNNDLFLDENTITIVGSELGEGTHFYTLEVEDINGCNIYDTVEVNVFNYDEYCPAEQNATICPGETYNFYGQEIGQPGIYTDTIISAVGCDTIVFLTLNHFELGSTGLEESVTMGLDDTITLTANEEFISYEWNNDPFLDENTITIVGSESGEGTFDYTLEVEDANGCIQNDTTEVIISPAVGIRTYAELEFSVYPNPVTGSELNMDYNIATEGMLIIYSQDGREVSRYTLSPKNDHIKILMPEAKGLYNLILRNNEGISHLKILKL